MSADETKPDDGEESTLQLTKEDVGHIKFAINHLKTALDNLNNIDVDKAEEIGELTDATTKMEEAQSMLEEVLPNDDPA